MTLCLEYELFRSRAAVFATLVSPSSRTGGGGGGCRMVPAWVHSYLLSFNIPCHVAIYVPANHAQQKATYQPLLEH